MTTSDPVGEAFWNLTDGIRPSEPYPGCFARVCKSTGRHVYDVVYGPRECALCGHRDSPATLRQRLVRRLADARKRVR